MPLKDYERDIERAKDNLEKDDKILKENKDLILSFERSLELNDYSGGRRFKFLSVLSKIARNIDIPFDKTEKKDVERIILWIKRRDDINKVTKRDYQVLLRRFYRWIGDGTYPDCIKWLEVKRINGNNKLPEEMLEEDDIKDLIDGAKNTRDKALISLLWESGARIGELVDLKIGSIEDREHGLKMVVSGKTGSRRIPLIESVPYLKDWLKEHPDGDNKKTPLWVNIEGKTKGGRMGYQFIRKTLIKAGERAGIDKPVNPHNFRHSRATYLASRFSEALLCEWFGWVQGSNIPSKYVHLSGKAVDDEYDRLHGIKNEDNPKESKLTPIDCPRCAEVNPSTAKYCNRCGMALTLEASVDMDNSKEAISGVFMELATENPAVLELLESEIRKVKDKMEK